MKRVFEMESVHTRIHEDRSKHSGVYREHGDRIILLFLKQGT
jgi:hypothetical protein